MGNDFTEANVKAAELKAKLDRFHSSQASLPIEEKLRNMDELQETAFVFRRVREENNNNA
jgi:hypothetical protein